jgi:hypothetical protein
MSTMGDVLRKVRRVFISTLLLSLWWAPNAARANANLNWQGGGYMKNYVVDVIFYGNNFTVEDQANVHDYVEYFVNYVNGQYNPPGQEPAVHYYGLWGVVPGEMIQDNGPPPTEIDDYSAVAEIQAAETGNYPFDAALDFNWNAISIGLYTAPNRIRLVLVKGVSPSEVLDYHCESIVTHPCNNDDGYHDLDNNGEPYAVVRFEQLEKTISHEVQEAMTDPDYWGRSGWQTNESIFGLEHGEACDDCNGAHDDPNLVWTGISGYNDGDSLSGVNRVTLDPSYGGINSSISVDSCQVWVPEQYAPIAATNNGAGTINLIYRTPAGGIEEMYFYPDDPNISVPYGPYDLGQPVPGVPGQGGVTAQGKPAIVDFEVEAPGAGQYIFVRGSDNNLWMNYNGWQNLGGPILGDPSAVNPSGSANVSVFVLSDYDTLYTFGISLGVLQGWSQLQTQGVLFSGPPKAFSRTTTSIDVFAVGEDGALNWVPVYSDWSATPPGPDLGTMDQGSPGLFTHPWGVPHHAPPSITSWGSDELDILSTAEVDVGHLGWNTTSGVWTGGFESLTGVLGSNAPSGTPAIVSWGPNRLDAFMIDRQNRLMHAYYDGSWHPDVTQPFATDAVGDPVAISRYQGQVEVFYRTTTGSLSHKAYAGGSWSTQNIPTALGSAFIYDPPPGGSATECLAGGWWMHCCPTGYVMAGANVNDNVFKCAPLSNPAGSPVGDTSTWRNNMHSCPYGQVMAGLRADQNILACVALPANAVANERVDSGTQDLDYYMHACDPGAAAGAMSGIDIGDNLFNCATTARIQ